MHAAKYWILILMLAGCKPLAAQKSLSLRFTALTIHPFGDPMAYLQPYKLDENAVAVFTPGLIGVYEKFIWKHYASARLTQGFFMDCSAGWASLTHIGLNLKLLRRQKFQVYLGIGPVFYIRESWNRFKEYESSGFLNVTSTPVGEAQYLFFPVAFEIESTYRINSRTDFCFAFTPGIPMGFFTSLGVKYWLDKNFSKGNRYYIPRK